MMRKKRKETKMFKYLCCLARRVGTVTDERIFTSPCVLNDCVPSVGASAIHFFLF